MPLCIAYTCALVRSVSLTVTRSCVALGIFFECCGAALKERLWELQGQLSALQHADRPLWEVALEELREPLDAEVDFPVVATRRPQKETTKTLM